MIKIYDISKVFNIYHTVNIFIEKRRSATESDRNREEGKTGAGCSDGVGCLSDA